MAKSVDSMQMSDASPIYFVLGLQGLDQALYCGWFQMQGRKGQLGILLDINHDPIGGRWQNSSAFFGKSMKAQSVVLMHTIIAGGGHKGLKKFKQIM